MFLFNGRIVKSKISEEIMNYEPFIKRSIELAHLSVQMGNHPFGALLVQGGAIILEAQNTVTIDKDVTCHAELNLVSEASRLFSPEFLKTTILYTSTEPCAMCAGAIYWSGIRHIVYACSAQRLGEIAGGSFVVDSKTLLRHGKDLTVVEGPFFEKEASELHQKFWKK